MEEVESLSVVFTSRNTTDVATNMFHFVETPPPSPQHTVRNILETEGLSLRESDGWDDLLKFRSPSSSTAFKGKSLIHSHHQEQREEEQVFLKTFKEEATLTSSEKASHHSRLVTPAKEDTLPTENTWDHMMLESESMPNRTVHHSHTIDHIMSPPRNEDYCNVAPSTPEFGMDTSREMTNDLKESPFGDYLDRKYNEIFNQEAMGSSQLPTLDESMDDSVPSILPSRQGVAKKFTIEQELSNLDEYTPIDLTRTNTTEIHQSLIALNASLSGPRVTPIDDIVRRDMDPVDAAIQENSIGATPYSMDDTVHLPILNLFGSGEISIPTSIGRVGDSFPIPSFQPKPFHRNAGWTDHIMNTESIASLRLRPEEMDLWRMSDIKHRGPFLTVAPSATSQKTLIPNPESLYTMIGRTVPFGKENEQQWQKVTRAHVPKRVSTELKADRKKRRVDSQVDKKEIELPPLPDIAAVVARQLQNPKPIVEPKTKTKVIKKKQSRKSKPPKTKIAKQHANQSLVTKVDKTPSEPSGLNSSTVTGSNLPKIINSVGTLINGIHSTKEISPKSKDTTMKEANETVSSKGSMERNDRQWLNTFNVLKEFHSRNGHIVVPSRDPKFFKLFNWLKRQVRFLTIWVLAGRSRSPPLTLVYAASCFSLKNQSVIMPVCSSRVTSRRR